MVEFRRYSPSPHGTDHRPEPLPSFPRLCLCAGPFQYQQEDYRGGPATAERFGRICSRCHLPAPGYDQLGERRFEFIPLWGFFVFLLYTMRRVDCRRCGVVAVEEVPWGDGKRTLTKSLHALPSALGAATVMEREGGGLSYVLGQGLRRGRTCCHLGSGTPKAHKGRHR